MSIIEATESQLLLENGTYEVTCSGVEDTFLDNPQFGDGEVVRFKLVVGGELTKDGKEIVLDPIANRVLSPKSKLWSFLVAFGFSPRIGQAFELEDCVGKRALAAVVAKTLPDGSKGFPRVESLMRLPTASKSRPVATAAVPPHEHDPAYTAKGDYVCGTCGKALDPQEEQPTELRPDFSGFWTRVRAAGKNTPDVLAVIGDLVKIATMTAVELRALEEQVLA